MTMGGSLHAILVAAQMILSKRVDNYTARERRQQSGTAKGRGRDRGVGSRDAAKWGFFLEVVQRRHVSRTILRGDGNFSCFVIGSRHSETASSRAAFSSL